MSLSSALVMVAVQVVGRFVFCDPILEYIIGSIWPPVADCGRAKP